MELQSPEGHRKRLRKKFTDSDGQGLSQCDLLELLLFYSVKRQDTKPVAKELSERFGSIENVINASESELESVAGLGESSAELLELIRGVTERLSLPTGSKNGAPALNPDLLALKKYAAEFYENETVPRLDLIILDGESKAERIVPLLSAFKSVLELKGRSIVDSTLTKNAYAAILTLYKPKKSYYPESEDVELLKYVLASLKKSNVELRDFVIVSKSGTFSLSSDYNYCNYF